MKHKKPTLKELEEEIIKIKKKLNELVGCMNTLNENMKIIKRVGLTLAK